MKTQRNSVKDLLDKIDSLRELKQLRKKARKGSEERQSLDTIIRSVQQGHRETYDKNIMSLKKKLMESMEEEKDDTKKPKTRRDLSRLQQFLAIPVNIINFVKSTLK